ncbi:Crp/Fnr family transcriptional regulator [Pedobacter frigidisoli]|uniref:Crp/Fnr family transcriptional regulator n=1 Tax=Pedobacter frigidisoli TaxID=2530455 RepID=A0A4R0NW02_9SPHI|nr:Crp/Fnr family transcriptional regulator [Pedobacter frigidisoli]TCD05861.1 Crp/Fnr family transcriptional regulator [Pedobacter frigidisoli]
MISDLYYQAIVDRIDSFCEISPAFYIALRPLLKVYKFPNSEYILRKGRSAKFAWFVIEGYLREVTNSNPSNPAHTTWFWYPGDFVLAYPVFFNQKEAISDIEVLPNTILLEISYEDFLTLRLSNPRVNKLEEELKFYYDKARIDHHEDLFNLSGKQKYQKFHNAHPALFNVVKHKDITSFLAMKDFSFRRYYSLLP